MTMSPSETVFLDHLAEHGWAVADDVVAPAFWRQALGLFDSRLQGFSGATIGTARAEHREIRGDRILWLEEGDAGAAAVFAWLEEWRTRLNREFSLGLRRVETHFAAYPAGAGYELHLDQPPGKDHRRLTFILYLNENWGANDGGELELHLPQCDTPRIIAPHAGRLVLFRSELFPHRVRPATRVRKSLTGWFRDDTL